MIHGARLGSRELFPDLEARAYLAHAAISPLSRPVSNVIDEVRSDYARLGLGAFMKWHERREQLRALAATLFSVTPECIGLTHNTTHGIQTVALGFPWKPGDRVICLRGEFPGNVTPWQIAAERFGGEVVWLDVGDFGGDAAKGLAELEAVLEPGAAVLAVSAVQFQTGLKMPLAEIAQRCRARGCAVFVDAIQAAGVTPIDPAHCDFMAVGGHKWLMGVEGTGLVYVAPDWMGRLRPLTAGWLSHEDPVDFLFEPDALRYDKNIRRRADFVEAGAYNTAGLAALEVGLGLVLEAGGPAAIHGHVQRYLDGIERGLADSGWRSLREGQGGGRSGILAFAPPSGVVLGEVAERLGSQGIVVSIPDGVLRIAPHWPNSLDEVPAVCAAILNLAQ